MDREIDESFTTMHEGHHHQSNHHEDSEPSMMMMKMFFHFGYGDTLLFSGLTIDSWLKMFLSCLVLFILAIFLEALNYVRRIKCACELRPLGKVVKGHDHDQQLNSGSEQLEEGGSPNSSHCQQQSPKTRRCCSSSSSSLSRAGSNCKEAAGCQVKHCELSLFRPEQASYRCLQALLYLFQTFLALTLMLAAMTYNVCIIFAIVLGAGLGYLLFYRPIVDVQLCH